MQDLAAMFNESLFGGNDNNNNNGDNDDDVAAAKSEDFKPEADVFDTEDSPRSALLVSSTDPVTRSS